MVDRMKLPRYLDPRSSWRNTSEVDKVRLYTRQSFVGLCVVFVVPGIAECILAQNWVAAAALVVCSAASVYAVLGLTQIGGTERPGVRWAVALCVVAAVIVGVIGEPQVALWALFVASAPLTALTSLQVSFLAAIVVAAGAFVRHGSAGAAAAFAIMVFMASTVRLSVWLLNIVTELDSSRNAASALSVAEERLRFSRDLHDVVGRSLSAIAVKSELAAALSRRGDERAAEQMDEVRDLAQQSMTEARQLVRGYRSIDLRAEIDGASSLLTAAGIDTRVVGSPDAVPLEFAEAAAWIVREGATNILRHSDAKHCRIEVSAHSVGIVNDGPRPATSSDGTGISGLRERLTAVGGSIEVSDESHEFALTATFPDKGRHSGKTQR